MVQIWERSKPLPLIRPVNTDTDYAMFIWKSKADLSFYKKVIKVTK